MPMDRDVLEIFPMLIPLRLPLKDEFSQNVFHPLASVRKTPPSPDELDPEKALLVEPAMYSCKNQLPSGDCGIYETRPHMCRHYPNGRRCEYVMCGSRTMKNLNAHSHVASGGAPFVPLDRVLRYSKLSVAVAVSLFEKVTIEELEGEEDDVSPCTGGSELLDAVPTRLLGAEDAGCVELQHRGVRESGDAPRAQGEVSKLRQVFVRRKQGDGVPEHHRAAGPSVEEDRSPLWGEEVRQGSAEPGGEVPSEP